MVFVQRDLSEGIDEVIGKEVDILPGEIFAARLDPVAVREAERKVVDKCTSGGGIAEFLERGFGSMPGFGDCAVLPPLMEFNVVHPSAKREMIGCPFVAAYSSDSSIFGNLHEAYRNIFVHKIIFPSSLTHLSHLISLTFL